MTSPYDLALPVSLRYFDGRMTPQGPLLSWQTTTETRRDRFVIERSSDLLRFEPIGTVTSQAPQGTATYALTYDFADTQPRPGGQYYRLA